MHKDAIDFLVLHQANQRILDSAAQRLGVPSERVVSNLAGENPAMVALGLAATTHEPVQDTDACNALTPSTRCILRRWVNDVLG